MCALLACMQVGRMNKAIKAARQRRKRFHRGRVRAVQVGPTCQRTARGPRRRRTVEQRQAGAERAPELGKCVGKTRFRQFQRHSVHAHATDEEAEAAACQPGGLNKRSFDMTHCRRINLHSRKLTADLCQQLILDETRLRWTPRTTSNAGCPQASHEPRKPDPVATEAKNGADCDQCVQLCQDPVDAVATTREETFSDKCQPHVAVVLRLLHNAGARKENSGNAFGDAHFVGVGCVKAMEVEFPLWSITGIVKNNAAGFPFKFLEVRCRSRPDRIRKAGFNQCMLGSTKSGLTPILAIAHKCNQDSAKIFISDCSLGVDCVHRWFLQTGERIQQGVSRPDSCCRFCHHANIIDNINRFLGHELDLARSWPVNGTDPGAGFWKKSFTHWEATIFTDCCLHMRRHGKLEIMPDCGPENIREFLDRFIGIAL